MNALVTSTRPSSASRPFALSTTVLLAEVNASNTVPWIGTPRQQSRITIFSAAGDRLTNSESEAAE